LRQSFAFPRGEISFCSYADVRANRKNTAFPQIDGHGPKSAGVNLAVLAGDINLTVAIG
jgi:hypothetical protein